MGYCIAQTLTGLSTDCENNIGGIKKAIITTFKEDQYTLDASGNTITGVNSSATWYLYTFRKESGNFTSTLNVDAPNGVNYVSTEINLVFARMESKKRLEMKALTLDDVNVVIVDSNGKYWGFGVNEPVNATAGTAETGTARGDGNKYSLTLTDYDSSYPRELSAEAITALEALIQNAD